MSSRGQYHNQYAWDCQTTLPNIQITQRTSFRCAAESLAQATEDPPRGKKKQNPDLTKTIVPDTIGLVSES